MKLITRLNLFFLLMLGISLGGAGLSIWSARQANYQIERINLAHDVYEGFLRLESHTYQLFKQYGDAMLIGDRDNFKGESELIGKIREDIASIRRTIGIEIELVGEEEIEELEALARIERKIEDLIASLDAITQDDRIDMLSRSWRTLSDVLDGEIDQEFRTLIDEALEEEIEEVVETKAEALANLRRYQIIASLFALMAVIAAMVGLHSMNRHLASPIKHLTTGMRRFVDGQTDYRFGPMGGSELADIGQTFDDLADRVTNQTDDLARQKDRLQEAVDERTTQLERLLKEARRSEANRRQLLADVSHELRTPLTIIRGESDIALRGGDKSIEAYKEALVRARDAAKHTTRLVDDLLLVARNESGELRLTKQTVELTSLVQDTVRTFGNGIAVLVDPEKAQIQADPERLRQVFLILLDNARNHGGDDIVLRLNTTPDGFRIAVEDDGPGMSEEERAHAFERFYRGSNATARFRDGIGLGLPVALVIAEAHGGTIQLDERPGGGTIAALHLPSRPALRAVS